MRMKIESANSHIYVSDLPIVMLSVLSAGCKTIYKKLSDESFMDGMVAGMAIACATVLFAIWRA